MSPADDRQNFDYQVSVYQKSSNENEPENEPMNNPKSLTSENPLFLYTGGFGPQRSEQTSLADFDAIGR